MEISFTPFASLSGGILIGLAAVFGVGWGIAGLLPAGALPALGTLDSCAIIFVGALIAGMPATRGVTHWAKPRAQQAE